MVSKPANLVNLVGKLLERYTATREEIQGHLDNAQDNLADASLKGATRLGVFNGTYNAAHSLALAAYKILGYRPAGGGHRQSVFNSLEHAVPATEADRELFIGKRSLNDTLAFVDAMVADSGSIQVAGFTRRQGSKAS
ncbi:MAG: hypothetical protein NTX56_19665 [Proteobacteria bacterium]|nr:hypothetical protein [Pseudomonadota bacterium]